MFRPFKTLSAVIITSAISLATVGIAFAEAPEPISTESSAAEKQYFTIDRSWLQLSIMNPAWVGEYTPDKGREDQDSRYLFYTAGDYGTQGFQVAIQYAMGSETEIEDLISRSQEPKISGNEVVDYLGTEKAESGQDIYVFSYYCYESKYINDICYTAISCGESGHNVYVFVNYDGERNTDENREKAFELFRSLSWSEPLDDLPEGTTEQDGQPADPDENSPETGAAVPVTAAFAAGGAAVVLLFARKNKRK